MRTSHVVATAAVFVTVTACQFPSPTRPSGGPELQIEGSTLLMVGGRGRLTAWAPRDGKLREVRATWSADGDAISLTSDGDVTGLRLGNALVRASADGLSGTATVHVVTNVAGKWRGSIAVVDCWDQSGAMSSACEGRRGLEAPLVMDVTQLSASIDHVTNLRAVVEIFSPPARGTYFGGVDSSGFLFLEGAVQRQADSFGGAVNFKWQLDGDRLIPFNFDSLTEDTVQVQMSMRVGTNFVLLNEVWRVSPMAR